MIFVFAASHVWADVREIFTRKDGDNAGHRLGLVGIDRTDACMRIGAAQKFAFGHFRYHEIAGLLCLASDLINTVDAVNRVANNRKFPLLLDHVLRPLLINTRISKSPLHHRMLCATSHFSFSPNASPLTRLTVSA